ncbi:MAG: histidine kinase, partial [Oscillospiraceae bacterium]|nr:histidine kinase [Oscillospiraceae bacterium]
MYNSYLYYADDDIKKNGWYTEAQKSETSKWQLIQNDEEYRLALIRPVTDKNDEFCGVMVTTVNPLWYEEMASEVNAGVVFSVSRGNVFYSSVDGCSEGTLLKANDGIRIGLSDSEILTNGDTLLEKKGYTVVSYFDYENTGNLFQVYVVKPYAIFESSVQDTVVAYVWYIFMCVILSVLITILFSSMFSRRIQFLQSKMHRVADGDFDLTEEIKGNDEIQDLYEDLKKMVDSMQKLMNDAYKSKIQSESFKLNQVEAEFKALASQINPHFLYNTLETIRMKAYCNDDKETADLVKKLGKFMRRCLEVKDGMVTLESELEFTSSYLELQAARFGDRVSYSIYCEVDGKYK